MFETKWLAMKAVVMCPRPRDHQIVFIRTVTAYTLPQATALGMERRPTARVLDSFMM